MGGDLHQHQRQAVDHQGIQRHDHQHRQGSGLAQQPDDDRQRQEDMVGQAGAGRPYHPFGRWPFPDQRHRREGRQPDNQLPGKIRRQQRPAELGDRRGRQQPEYQRGKREEEHEAVHHRRRLFVEDPAITRHPADADDREDRQHRVDDLSQLNFPG
jgi:hypothetical protein